ncbi:hypothetical protein BGZ63DRAFT_113862 [Mariannaea sp. PMI_226]|nr:hypothetical protein BGZ63DRAFT_113862 [Mariannaea sp. PMI_226]
MFFPWSPVAFVCLAVWSLDSLRARKGFSLSVFCLVLYEIVPGWQRPQWTGYHSISFFLFVFFFGCLGGGFYGVFLILSLQRILLLGTSQSFLYVLAVGSRYRIFS